MNDRPDLLPAELVPPSPPPELRRRTLTAARAVLREGRAPDLWHRLWTSRPARLAWAATVAALLIGHLVVAEGPRRSPAEPALTAALATVRGELAEVAELGRLTAELPGWEIATARSEASPDRKESS